MAEQGEELRRLLWLRKPLPATEANNGDFWAVWQAAERLFPARLTPAFLHGMTGGALRSHSCPLFQSDLLCWLVPGLAWCGVQAELLALNNGTAAWLPILQEQLRQRIAMPLFAFAVPSEPEDFTDLPPAPVSATVTRLASRKVYRRQESPDPDVLELPLPDAPLQQQTLATALDTRAESLTISDMQGTLRAIGLEELPNRYSHALVLWRDPVRCSRATQVSAAMRQWAAFACACPERAVRPDAKDAYVRALAAEFWRGLAGRERSPSGTSLRHLADLFATAANQNHLQAAFRLIYEAACVVFALPHDVEAALLAPLNNILTDSERRELIYLCRAGTRDLKILAAHRLAYESDHADARSALQQLRYDADAWVRGEDRRLKTEDRQARK